MSGKNGYTAKQFIAAIPGTGGIVTAIAKKVGCSRHTAQRYIDLYPTVKEAWQDERESIIDMGETALFRKVNDGEGWAVKYMLSTIGKHRGYVERQELKHSGQIDVSELTDDELDDIIAKG